MSWNTEQYRQHFEADLEALKRDGRYRTFATLERICGEFPYALSHDENGTKKVVVWCSNDYLGMGQHPVVLQTMKDAIDQWGAGSGGTRNIGGTTYIHTQLENALADWHHKESAHNIYIYHANTSAML